VQVHFLHVKWKFDETHLQLENEIFLFTVFNEKKKRSLSVEEEHGPIQLCILSVNLLPNIWNLYNTYI
jgi:hypothetical protein